MNNWTKLSIEFANQRNYLVFAIQATTKKINSIAENSFVCQPNYELIALNSVQIIDQALHDDRTTDLPQA